MKHKKLALFFVMMFLLAISFTMPAWAQESVQSDDQPALSLLTDYPSQLVGAGETATLDLTIKAGEDAQIIDLMVEDLPADWSATFRGKNRVVQSVYVQPEKDAVVDPSCSQPHLPAPPHTNRS